VKIEALEMTDDFASAMQQLSAEAEQSLPPDPLTDISKQLSEVLKEFRGLNERVTRLEQKVDAVSTPFPEFTARFHKLDQQLSALRESETVNQRLFDSLHDELIRYRDNFLHESLQKPFIRDLLVLFDDLSAVASQLENGGERVPSQARQNVENTLHALLEILHRLETTEMEPVDRVDRKLHKVVSYEPTNFQDDDGRIVMRLKRGFMWRDKVLRAEEVVATRFE
jgi:molecular chaperone GrpE (heat shock protein)